VVLALLAAHHTFHISGIKIKMRKNPSVESLVFPVPEMENLVHGKLKYYLY
jgi:hypothetical protein